MHNVLPKWVGILVVVAVLLSGCGGADSSLESEQDKAKTPAAASDVDNAAQPDRKAPAERESDRVPAPRPAASADREMLAQQERIWSEQVEDAGEERADTAGELQAMRPAASETSVDEAVPDLAEKPVDIPGIPMAEILLTENLDAEKSAETTEPEEVDAEEFLLIKEAITEREEPSENPNAPVEIVEEAPAEGAAEQAPCPETGHAEAIRNDERAEDLPPPPLMGETTAATPVDETGDDDDDDALADLAEEALPLPPVNDGAIADTDAEARLETPPPMLEKEPEKSAAEADQEAVEQDLIDRQNGEVIVDTEAAAKAQDAEYRLSEDIPGIPEDLLRAIPGAEIEDAPARADDAAGDAVEDVPGLEDDPLLAELLRIDEEDDFIADGDDPAAPEADGEGDAEGEGETEAEGETTAPTPGTPAAEAMEEDVVEGEIVDGEFVETDAEAEAAEKAEEEKPKEPMTEEQKRAAELERMFIITERARILEARTKYKSAQQFFDQGQFDQARQLLEESLRLNPELAEARDLLRRTRQMLGRPESGDDIDAALDKVTNMTSHMLTELKLRIEKQLNEAESNFLSARNPSSARKALDRASQIAQGKEELESALELIRDAQQLSQSASFPHDTEQRLDLRAKALRAQVLKLQRELTLELETIKRQRAYEARREARRESNEQLKKRLDSLFESAEFYHKRKEYGKAIELIEKIIEIDPNIQKAKNLRQSYRNSGYNKNQRDIDQEMENSEVNWAQDIEQARILPRELVIYPKDWDQIRMRSARRRVETDMSAEERRILDRLDSQITSTAYEGVALSIVIDQMQHRCGVNIVLDQEVEGETPIDLTMRDVSYLRVLEWLMELYRLDYRIEHQAIYIQPAGRAGRDVILQLYPVADLLRLPRDFSAPSIESDIWGDDDDDDFGVDAEPVNLVDRIQEVIDPESWEDDRTSIDMWQENLMIMQTPEVHQKVAQYMKLLREAAKQQVLVEGRFLRVDDEFYESIGVSWDLFTWERRQNREVRTGMTVRPGNNMARSNNLIETANNALRQPYGLITRLARTVNANARFDAHYNPNLPPTPSVANATGATTALNNSFQNPGGVIALPILKGYQIGAVLDAAQMNRQGSLMHNPRLLVANGKNAYVIVRVTSNYITNYTVQGIYVQPEIGQFVQGVTWDVRPVISFDRKYITVRMRPRLETLLGQAEERRRVTTHPGDDTNIVIWEIPIMWRTTEVIDYETNATVPDGGTVLIGGEIRDNRTESVSGIPVLSSLPGLGRLFRTERSSRTGQNRVIMLSARIVELQD